MNGQINYRYKLENFIQTQYLKQQKKHTKTLIIQDDVINDTKFCIL